MVSWGQRMGGQYSHDRDHPGINRRTSSLRFAGEGRPDSATPDESGAGKPVGGAGPLFGGPEAVHQLGPG